MKHCKIVRRVLVRSYNWNVVTDQQTDVKEYWEEKPCDNLLFGGKHETSQVCRSCLSGYAVKNNFPLETPYNDGLFEKAKAEMELKNK